MVLLNHMDSGTSGVNGADCSVSGKFGSGCGFDGNDDYVDLGNIDVSGNALTISLWFKADDLTPYDVRLISKAITTGQNAEQDHFWMVSSMESSGRKLRFRTSLLKENLARF